MTGENHSKVKLVREGDAVGLAFSDAKRGKPFFVDFTTGDWRRRFKQGLTKKHIFRRALNWREGQVICDATAGFGQDTAMALTLGALVVAIERSPVVAEVLKDGVRRAREASEDLNKLFSKLEIREGDAREILPQLQPDIVYLDPMFMKMKGKAKSPKSMQLLQELIGPSSPEEEQELFNAAWSAARSRVVVKRPLKFRIEKGPLPTHSLKGQSIRYDVYVKS